MSNFIIEGGKKLHGKIKTNPAKNPAVAILCASTMIKGKTILNDVPNIEDVKRIIEILNSINIKIEWTGKNKLTINNNGRINLKNLNKKACKITRSSFLLTGALSTCFNTFSIFKPGGCQLGERTLSSHLLGFKNLGITFSEKNDKFIINANRKKPAQFVMYEMSDTGTENLIMAACLIPGKTIINMAASNYMVQDLCIFLNKAGAKIKGIGTSTLEINGVKKLKPVNYNIMPDPIDSMAFIAAAIATHSTLTITNCPIDFLALELEKLRVLGQKFKISNIKKSKNKYFTIADIKITPSKLTALPDKIHAQPYPGLNIDNLPLFIPILTQAKGSTLMHDWVYENRAIYALELNKLNARIKLQDPHRLIITGPTKFKPAEIICPPALRSSMNILICMLAAKGKSILRNVYSINRGYEDIVGRLIKIGADIKKIDN
ncbi:MAG: UDP-N-acetylglucosamine 1-carboxyvinyltransferase [Patescibacteria group bacterium]